MVVVRADTLISMNHKLMKFSISSPKWEILDEESLISESSSKIPISAMKSYIDLFKEHIFVSLNHKTTSDNISYIDTFDLRHYSLSPEPLNLPSGIITHLTYLKPTRGLYVALNQILLNHHQ